MSSDEEGPEFDCYEIPKVGIPADLISRFGRSDRVLVRREPVLAVERLSVLAKSTYQLLVSLMFVRGRGSHSVTELFQLVDENRFVRVWRYLLLRRAQDVQSQTNGERSDGYLKNFSALGLMVPAPLADLLHSYGQYESEELGYLICPLAPAAPQTWNGVLPDWYQLDPGVIQGWVTACAMLSSVYEMKEFPPCNQYKGTAIMLTSRTFDDNLDRVTIRSPTREPTITDVYLRVVNEDLFENNPFSLDRLGFLNAAGVSRTQLRTQYLCNYIKGTL